MDDATYGVTTNTRHEGDRRYKKANLIGVE